MRETQTTQNSASHSSKSTSYKKALKRALLEKLMQEGITLLLSEGCFDELQEAETQEGELIWLKDKEILILGEDQKTLKDLRFFLPLKVENSSSSLEAQMQFLWHSFEQTLTLGEVAKVILPKLAMSIFESIKPKNFSFLQGEALPTTSPFSKEWERSPDARGRFLRVYSDISQIGKTQESQVGAHIHQPLYKGIKSMSYHSCQPSQQRDSFIGVSHIDLEPSPPTKKTEDEAEETRPNNIVVAVLWKIGEVL